MIDLFAGVGGWDLAARALGYDPLGIEMDPIACETRRAAELTTLCADVTTLDEALYPARRLLIASPPCQFFSTASPKRKVVSDKPYNIKRRTKWREYSAQGPDLIQEPMRWIRKWEPESIALEQVPGALPTWIDFSLELLAMGYSVWTGILNAADYGSQQDRSRAVLMASWSKLVSPPEKQPRFDYLYPTIVCNRRSKGGIVVGRSLKDGGIPMTFAEAGVVQGFPRNYPWHGGVEAKSRQIGNAIPVPLATAVLTALLCEDK
jgi:DNA (cytosine-5)-methyltransferase 1